MEGFTRLPGPEATSRPDPADLMRLAEALESADRTAVPDDPLSRHLHLAVAELARPGPIGLGPRESAVAPVPLHLALTAIESLALDTVPSGELVRLIVRMDEAQEILETPDLRPVATDLLASRLRELYAGIVRTRATAGLLHRAWTATGGRSVP